MEKNIRKPQFWLVISIILILVSSVFANLFNTSGYKVKVTEISFKTDKGVLNGLLYMPDGVSEANPRPTIVTTHGYLNAKEMQDAPAIEMSRRGYVVLALDMYEHGSSVLNTVSAENSFLSFWPTSVYDAVQYMYNQPYVLKDEKGNGMIGVSGHSMGGFSSTMAMYYDEQDYNKDLKENKPAIRKIAAVLPVGADYSNSTYLGVDAQTANKSYGSRTAGIISGHYDEFFFDAEASKTGKTVVYKDFANTTDGKIFLGNPKDPKPGVFYKTKDGGKRIIYEPSEFHAMNPISPATAKSEIEFYNEAFGKLLPTTTLSSSNQIWWLKELCQTVGLVGFFLLFIPLLQILLKRPFLGMAKSESISEFEGPKTKSEKTIYWILISLCTIFPAFFYTSFMDKNPAGASGLNVLKYIALIIFAITIIGTIVSLVKQKDESITRGYVVTAISSFIMFGLMTGANNIFNLSKFFNEPETNLLIFWALGVTSVIVVILCIVYYLINKPAGMDIRQYGFVVNWKKVVAAFANAAIITFVAYIILFIINVLLKTDFRFWTFAVRSINKQYLITGLYYMPFYFLYYFVNGIAIHVNTNSKYMKGVKGYLVAYLLNIGGLVAYLLLQYGKDIITGTALFPNQALNGIVLVALVPTLLVATIITKKSLDKTNNVYTGAFLNTFVMTLITVSSSTIFWNIR